MTEALIKEKKLSEYQIRPKLEDKFKSMAVRDIIHDCLNKELTGKVYSASDCEIWTNNVVKSVKESVKNLNLKRYKIIVHVVMGEHKGAGVKIGARCLWDVDTDSYATDTFLNDSLFCCVVVFGVYTY